MTENNNPNPPLDPKVGMTVVTLAKVFLEDRNKILFFSCDTTDGRQSARFRKFTAWFSLCGGDNHMKFDDRISMLSAGKKFLFTLLVDKDNLDAQAVIQAVFDLMEDIRSQK